MIKFLSMKHKYNLFGKQPGFLSRDTGTIQPYALDMLLYNSGECEKFEDIKLADALAKPHDGKVRWLIYRGLPPGRELEVIGREFGLHSIVLEDIQNCAAQRPGSTVTENYLTISQRFPLAGTSPDEFKMTPMFLAVFADTVITFEAADDKPLALIVERIVEAKGQIRSKGADYLGFCHLDLAIDYYFIFLEKLGDDLDQIEAKIVKRPEPEMLAELQRLKRIGSSLRKNVWPMREMVHSLRASGCPLVAKPTEKYFNDLDSHMLMVFDNAEIIRDMISSQLEVYLSSVSNKMNEVMKVLTLIATLFIPLTFIAGVYGMNFKYMPELEWHNGYFMTLGIMALVALIMLLFFRRKKWL